jgi:hypothetical protein
VQAVAIAAQRQLGFIPVRWQARREAQRRGLLLQTKNGLDDSTLHQAGRTGVPAPAALTLIASPASFCS